MSRRAPWMCERSKISISGRTPLFLHLAGEVLDQGGVVLVDDGREVDRAGRERGHVGLEVQRRAAGGGVASASAGGELDDHAGAVFSNALLHLAEQFRVGGGAFVGVADVDVDERGAGLVGLVRALDLLGGRDRQGRVVLLARNRPGNRYRNYDRPHG